jgi:branched-chain amino acid transport system permease protein
MSKTGATSMSLSPAVAATSTTASRRGGVVRAAAIALVFLAVGLAVPAAVGSVLLMTLLVQATINAIFALSVGVLLRMNGVVSFGNAAFYGFAVYVVGIGVNRGGIPAELVIAAALILPASLGFVLGLGVVGVPGAAFAMLTLAVGQAFYEFAIKARDLTGGEDGFDITFPQTLFSLPGADFQSPRTMFVICWAVLILTIFLLYLISRTRFGRIAIAIRENEERARFIGYRTRARRAAVLALSAFIAAMAGALLALYSAYVSPDVLHWSASGSALIMAITGGAQLLWGPALGAVIFFFFKDIVGDLTEHWQALIGITLIVVTLLIPDGVGGWLTTLRFGQKTRGSR